MKKFVLNLDLQDDKEQQRRALKTVSTLPGIDEIAIDLKGKKLTVIGTVDPVSVVSKLRKKNWPANIISVGPAKEPEKKEEPKKEEAKKEEGKKEEGKEEAKKEGGKKEEGKKEEEPKKEEGKKEEPKKEEIKLDPELFVPRAMPYPTPMPYPTQMPYPTPMPYPTTMQYKPYRPYYPPMNTYYQQVPHHSMEENPNACTIS